MTYIVGLAPFSIDIVIDLVLLVILTLAVARMCVLMVTDKITEPFRHWVRNTLGTEHMLTYGSVCPWCWSIWFAFPMTWLTLPGWTFWHQTLAALAVSYVASRLADR